MEAGVMEELRVCQEERDILKQKLHIHLDRWTLDKIMFGEMAAKAAREIRRKEFEKNYQTAQKEMLLGSQKQQLVVLKLKLDSALEDMERKEIQVSVLKSQLQEERKWRDSVKEKSQETKARFAMVAAEKPKILVETERKIKRLQTLLDDKVQSHKAEVELVKSKHALAVAQLKEEIKRLASQDNHAKAQQIRWILERKQLKALARERDHLIAEQQQWRKDKNELHVVLEERDNLKCELMKRNSRQKEMRAIKDERDRLTSGKDNFIPCDFEMEELVKDRDGLSAQRDDLISHGEDLHELVMESDKLKRELDPSNAQRQDEVSALVRERDFVWSPMKNLDKNYGKRIKKMSKLNLQDRQKGERLKNDFKGAQVGNNETMVESTILELEVKRVEDPLIQKQRAHETELQELQSNLKKVKEEKKTVIADAFKKGSLLLELPDCSYQEQGAWAVGDGFKEVPEVLNAVDGPTPKAAKVTIKANHRDPTSRKLKLELEAVAGCCPSDGSPTTDGNVRKQKKHNGNQKLALGTIRKKSKVASSKSGREEGHSSQQVEVSSPNARRSKGMSSNGKCPSDENKFVPSPQKLRPRSRVDYSDSINPDRSGQDPVKKRRKGTSSQPRTDGVQTTEPNRPQALLENVGQLMCSPSFATKGW